MRKIKEILRLKAELAMSDRKIAAAVGSSRSTVQECLRRCRQAGIGWPLPADLDEAAIITRLYERAAPARRAIEIDFAQVHRELARPGVTRELPWREHKSAHPQGVQYTAFCNQYRRWLASQELVLRQAHNPGDKAFIDYAGQTVAVIDRLTGEVRAAQIFVAVLGCSNYTFAEATFSQRLADWLGSHVRALEYFGGVPRAFVPDNLKSAVTKARRYEPDLCPAYSELAEHYGVAILPARVRKPRDKAKVETGVLIVERWILARLRNRTFFSLAERPFKKMAGCRRSRRMHPEETLRSAQGILRLGRDFSPAQLEVACQRALTLRSYSYRAVRTFTEVPAAAPAQPALDLAHENVRGPEYFQ